MPEPTTQLVQRCVEPGLEGQRRQGAILCRLAVPDDVKNDLLVGWIAVVAVAVPAGGMQINLDITTARRAGTELNDGIAEIRPGFMVPKARMKNPDWISVQGFQSIALQTLVSPDLLQ